jgi:hypothetical protein
VGKTSDASASARGDAVERDAMMKKVFLISLFMIGLIQACQDQA